MAPAPHGPQRCWRREAWDSALPASPLSAHLTLVHPSYPHLPASVHLCLPHPSACLNPCLPSSPLSALLALVCKPRSVSAHLSRLPASVHVRPPHPSAHLTPVHLPHPCLPASPICPPQPCPLSSPVCPPAQGPPSSPWSKRLRSLRRDQPFPGGSASGRRPPWSRDQGLRGQHSLGVGGARAAQWGGLGDAVSWTHTAPQAGGRPCMRVGWGEGAVASAGSSGKGSPSRTEKAPDANCA